MTADASDVDDVDGVPTDDDGDNDVNYQWLRNGEAIPGATSSTYTLGPDDNEKTISVQVSFIDDARYYEMRVSNATSTIAGSPGEISRIEAAIRSVTVSGGDDVTLSVDIYGLQNAKDNGIGNGVFTWTVSVTKAPSRMTSSEVARSTSPLRLNRARTPLPPHSAVATASLTLAIAPMQKLAQTTAMPRSTFRFDVRRLRSLRKFRR